MKRMLVTTLLTGGFLTLLTSVASAATITLPAIVVGFANTDWEIPDVDNGIPALSFAKYNPANYDNRPLLSVRIEAIAETRGSYNLTNDNPLTPNRRITYGTYSDQVGASLTVSAPSFSIELSPVPITSIGSGVLNSQQSITRSLDGRDTKNLTILPTNSNFSNFIFTGTGNSQVVLDQVFATSLINVSKLGSPFTESASIEASLQLSVTYEIADPPLEIPERGFNLLSLILGGLAGLALTTYSKSV